MKLLMNEARLEIKYQALSVYGHLIKQHFPPKLQYYTLQ